MASQMSIYLPSQSDSVLVETIFISSSLYIEKHPIIGSVLFSYFTTLTEEKEQRGAICLPTQGRKQLGIPPPSRTTLLRTLGDLEFLGLSPSTSIPLQQKEVVSILKIAYPKNLGNRCLTISNPCTSNSSEPSKEISHSRRVKSDSSVGHMSHMLCEKLH